MFKKTMKFDNLLGEPVEQTFYFHYDRKEVAELLEFGYISRFRPDNIESRQPLEKQLEILKTPVAESGLSEKENTQQAYDIFQDLILDAYGEKGADNVSFVKNDRTREYFRNHVAFPELIFEMIGDPRLAASFVENCLPAREVEAAKAELTKQGHTGASLHEMVEEAARRQEDPATRIEPGPEAAREALGANPEIEKAAAQIASTTDGGVPARKTEELVAADIEEMDDIAFKKLDIQKLNKEAMFAAFKRKSSS